MLLNVELLTQCSVRMLPRSFGLPFQVFHVFHAGVGSV